MNKIPIGTIKQHKLTKHDEKIWQKYMSPKYVYETDGAKYVNLKFVGYDKMEQEWRITPVKEERTDV